MSKEVILTGLRSNSEFHLGNYLGAILPMVELQKKHAGRYQLNMFIPDLHSFTTPIEHGSLYEQTLKNLKVFVAAGLDISNSDTFIYRQSYIPAHSELTWIFNCFSYFGELSRMTQFKEKGQLRSSEEVLDEQLTILERASENIDKGVDREKTLLGLFSEFVKQMRKHINEHESSLKISMGLLGYPLLMAADILLYNAKWVPVGDDQRQHLEFTRNLAERMNNRFGEVFVVPEDTQKQLEFSGRSSPVRIRSFRNPEKKMSKSIEDPAGTIMLSDKPDEAAQKVVGATTDSIGVVHYDWSKQPGVSNLLQILSLLSNRSQPEVIAEWEGKSSYGELKTAVAEAVRSFLTDFQSRLSSVNQEQLLRKLEADEEAMTKVANATLLKVQQAVGIRPKS